MLEIRASLVFHILIDGMEKINLMPHPWPLKIYRTNVLMGWQFRTTEAPVSIGFN